MKRVNLDQKDKKIREFVRSLSINPTGSILELEGKPVLKVLPLKEEAVDKVKLKAAILKRRNESRSLNQEWEALDRDMWDRLEMDEE